MSGQRWMTSVLVLAAVPLIWPVSSPAPQAGGKVVTVKMVDVSTTQFKYDPAEITVQPGDTVRFVQTATTPHNVDFKTTPAGVDLGGGKMGPFLVTAGQTYDVVIDPRFSAGAYQFACTPHETFGMKGVITVAGK